MEPTMGQGSRKFGRVCLFALSLAAFAGPAVASPKLEVCLPFAAKSCGLTAKSPAADFIQCMRFYVATTDEETLCLVEIAHARVHQACDEEIPVVCAGVEPGNDRVMTCLRENAKKLTPACRTALKKFDAAQPKKRKRGGVAEPRC